MLIDTSASAAKVHIRNLFIALAFMTLIIVILITNIVPKQWAFNRWEIATTLLGLYILLNIHFSFIRYNYLYLKLEPAKLIVRYFALSPFNKKRSVEIPLKFFGGHTINRRYFGLRQDLILFQKTKNGTAKYPPISISILSDQERKKVEALLKGLKAKL